MSDRDGEAGHSSGLLRGLIWAGLLLAPVAAAIVLLGGGGSGSVRFAVLLVAVSVVLIGASVLIGNDPVLHRMEVEDRVTEAVGRLRRELRAEFARDAAAGRSVGRGDSGFFLGQPMRPGGDPFAPSDHAAPAPEAAEPPGPVEAFGAARVVPSAAVVPRQRGRPFDGYAAAGREDHGYGVPGGFEGSYEPESDPFAADPGYRAKRHRPSPNDTNVGSLADFAEGSEGHERTHDDYGGPQPGQERPAVYGHPQVEQERPPVYGRPQAEQERPPVYGRPQVDYERPAAYGRPQVDHERPGVYGRPPGEHERPGVYGRPPVDYGRPPVDYERSRGGQDPRARGARPDERYVGGDSGPRHPGPNGAGRW